MTLQAMEQTCDLISLALAEIRKGIRARLQPAEFLDSFWRLQDNLARIVDAASDNPTETLRYLKSKHSAFSRNIIAVLSILTNGCWTRNSGIKASCDAVNEMLIKLEQLKELSNAKTATASNGHSG
jgi:hypothetical protein